MTAPLLPPYTLFVSPSGESLLFDTGYPGNGDRDAKRIFAAAQKAGLKQIDHVVISHWHGDHVGGLEALAKLIPLGRFYDHGNGVEEAEVVGRVAGGGTAIEVFVPLGSRDAPAASAVAPVSACSASVMLQTLPSST